MNSLSQYKYKGQILKDMGLQNKLNLLLYGIPGTGKSTTIQAVATFLQKDIYYVDLQKATCNTCKLIKLVLFKIGAFSTIFSLSTLIFNSFLSIFIWKSL